MSDRRASKVHQLRKREAVNSVSERGAARREDSVRTFARGMIARKATRTLSVWFVK